jgi:hypothetical protein
VDKGSTFSFRARPCKDPWPLAEEEMEMMEVNPELRGIRVLVVEDIALNQLLMKTLLDDFGFERDIAANGKIAHGETGQPTAMTSSSWTSRCPK